MSRELKIHKRVSAPDYAPSICGTPVPGSRLTEDSDKVTCRRCLFYMVGEVTASHARLSPSAMAYRARCPHYRNNPTPNTASTEGTLIHNALETGDWSQLTDDQKVLAQQCADYVDGYVEDDTVRVNEMKLHVMKLDENDSIHGTADVVLLHKDNTADVIDYKMGLTEIDDADENLQGQCYVLGVWNKFPHLDTVRVHFLLPRQNSILDHAFNSQDLEDIRLKLLAINAASHNPDAPYHATGDGCCWCANKSDCPELNERAVVLARNYGGLPLPEHFEPRTMTSVADRNMAQMIAPILEDWAKQVKANNTRAVVEEGLELPDFKVISRGGGRRVADMGAAFETLRSVGVSPEQFMLNCTIKIGDLEDIIRDVAKQEGLPIGETLDNTMIELERRAAVARNNPIQYLKRVKNKST